MTDNLCSRIDSKKKNISDRILSKLPWSPEKIEDVDAIPSGDMPGDKIMISSEHIKKAEVVFPKLIELLIPILDEHPYQRAVVAVYGGSGVGKSEIASLLSYFISNIGIGSYVLSGDNYVHRIPKYNDMERIRVFRRSGIRGLISQGQYIENRGKILKELQKNSYDADPSYVKDYPWLSIYQSAGRNGLGDYLGSMSEIDFDEINNIILQFRNNSHRIFLKRMGRKETEVWYECADFSDKNILIIEWTHANNHNILGLDIPILLNSTPKDTLEHRMSRNRDSEASSHFTAMVLDIEQDMLISQASRAKLIVSKSGELLSYENYLEMMQQG